MKVTDLCQLVGMTRQNYYKMRSIRKKQSIDEDLMLQFVRRERAVQPQLGGRKLLHLLRPELHEAGVSIGRDRFFEFMGSKGLLIARRRRQVKTTDSRHGFVVYENLLKDMKLTDANQAFVSDITYIRTEEGFLYLALMMDAFSRMVVGYDCSDSLEAEGALRALSQTLRQLPAGSIAVHHSDRGLQYCCHRYVEMLKSRGLRVSMTQENHCYENGRAERLNGILKQEYGLGETFLTKADAMRAVRQAVELYNCCRPHQALGYRTPMSVHIAA